MSQVYSSSDPRRPPNWRQLRAISLLDAGRRPSRTQDDEWVRQVFRLMTALRGCRQPLDFAAASAEFGPLYWAYDINFDAQLDGANSTKAELEARLLTGQDDEAIAARFGTDPEVIAAYARTYFDVRWAVAANARGYIIHQVLGPSMHAGFSESDYATLWKFAGYTGGPEVLDAVIDIVPATFTHTGNASDWFNAAVSSQLNRKALVAATVVRPNSFNATEILAAYLKMCEMARARAASGRSDEHSGFIEAIELGMRSLPIVAATSRRSTDELECAEIEHSNKIGVEYTVEERLCLRSGMAPSLPGDIPLDDYTFPEPAAAGATAMEGIGS